MFNIQIAQKSLAYALKCVESTVGDNSQNLGDDCISLTDNGDYTLDIYTTNSIEFSKVSVILATGSSGTVEHMPYVNFKRFKQIIDSISENEFISIKSNVNDIEITYGTRKKPLKLVGSSNGMISLPQTNSVNEIIVYSSFIENALKKACTIIKDDGQNSLTNCIKVSTKGYDIEITAVDTKSNRMFLCKGKTTESNNGDVFLEANKLKKAFKLFTEFSDLSIEPDNNIIMIKGVNPASSNTLLNGAEYYIRTFAGNYPNNISNAFNSVTEYSIINKDEVKSSLMRIDAIEDTTIGSGTLELLIDKNLVNIVKTSQYGVVEDSFSAENEISYTIKDTFKAKSLTEILKNFVDNGYYGSPNTFEIGKGNATSNANYYVLRETGNTETMFLVTGFVNTSNQTP